MNGEAGKGPARRKGENTKAIDKRWGLIDWTDGKKKKNNKPDKRIDKNK